MTQPMVVVKKPDGTLEHITLEELKKRRATAKKVSGGFVIPPAKPVVAPAPKPVIPPVTPRPVAIPPARPAVIPPAKPVTPPAQPAKSAPVQSMRPATVPVPVQKPAVPDAKIMTRVLDIRERARLKKEETITPRKDDFVMEDMLPQKFITPPPPVNTMPHNTFVHSEKVTPSTPLEVPKEILPTVSRITSAEVVKPVPAASSAPSIPVRPTSSPMTPPGNRPVVNDIVSRPSTMSPLDEVRYFSLVDFRRLSANPMEAAARLKQKFINLKDESILWYFEAFEAWHISPLYLDYMNAVATALSQKAPLAGVTTDPNRIQPKEVEALATMEKELL